MSDAPDRKQDWTMESTTSRSCGVSSVASWNASNADRNRNLLLSWATTPEMARDVLEDKLFLNAGPAQTPPDGDWRVWLFMGGRGAGKTWAGARWTTACVMEGQARRIALVGPTLGDVREVMIEGPSGLIALAPDHMKPLHEVSRRRVTWPNGAVGHVFSAEDPQSLRGPQFDAAWCDEIVSWARGVQVWDTLAFGMRLGAAPRIVATTTPRATPLVKRLVKQNAEGRGGVVLTQAETGANAHNLAPGFLGALEDDYGGSHLLRQERMGVLMEDAPGAMWAREAIERNRMRPEDAPEMDRVVVAVDPPAGVGAGADACGIVAAGRAGERYFVLGDATRQGLRPLEWAKAALKLARSVGAAEIVAEANQGGEMVRDVIVMADAGEMDGPRVTLTHATASKQARAEPVSALYDRGLVQHVGGFGDLEDEMCAFCADETRRSPDRVDALVWAIRALMKPRARPSVAVL